MSSPELCSPLTADSLPAPGPLRLTSTSRMPAAIAAFAASCAATVAANAEDFLDPDDLREELRLTVLHEIAHYFGMDEDEIEDLGY